MAFTNTFFFLSIVLVAILARSIFATEFIVGDSKGWSLNFDHQAWTQGKEFRVGDKLIFKYPSGAHNVMKVDGVGFQQCVAGANTEALTSGEDVITLATPGRKWYICGVGKHCAAGSMKLLVTVLPETGSPAGSPAPVLAPGASTSASAVAKISYGLTVVAMLGLLGMALV